MTITPTTLTRAAGVAAVAAGLIFIGVQFNHPHLDVTSITTTEVVVRNSLKVLMAVLALVGITGMYLSQVRRNGLLGLIGYVVLGGGYLLIMSTTFVAASVLPLVAGTDPAFVTDVIAVSTGGTASGDIGLLQYADQGPGSRLPARRTRLRHRPVPRTRPGPLGLPRCWPSEGSSPSLCRSCPTPSTGCWPSRTASP